MQINEKAKPFIKWAGGKGQLLSQLDKYLPRRLYNEDFTYVEPFTGGGICNADTILADSALLNKVDIEITNRSFEETADFIKSDRLTFFISIPRIDLLMPLQVSLHTQKAISTMTTNGSWPLSVVRLIRQIVYGCLATLIVVPRILMICSLKIYTMILT